MSVVSMRWPEYKRACCRIDGRRVKLRPLEAEVLLVLLLWHPDQWLTKDEVMFRVWHGVNESEGADSTLSVYLHRMRKRGIIIENWHESGRYQKRLGGIRIPRHGRGDSKIALAA